MNVRLAQYILPKLLKAGKGSSRLAQSAAQTIFANPQAASQSTSIFTRIANSNAVNTIKQTTSKAIKRIGESKAYNAVKTEALVTASCIETSGAVALDQIKSTSLYRGMKLRLLKNSRKFKKTELYQKGVAKTRRALAGACRKSSFVRDVYGELYNAGKAFQKGKLNSKYDGPFKFIGTNGAGAVNLAKEVGPIPFSTAAAGAVAFPAPGTAEIGLLTGVLAKQVGKRASKHVTKVTNEIMNIADTCFLTLVK